MVQAFTTKFLFLAWERVETYDFFRTTQNDSIDGQQEALLEDIMTPFFYIKSMSTTNGSKK